MNGIELNLARRPFTNDTLAWVLVGSLAAAGLGLTVWNVSLFMSVHSQIAALTRQRDELEKRQRAAEKEQDDLLRSARNTVMQLGASRATFANTIIQQWAFSWTGLFNELERVIPYGVRLRSVRPRFEDGVRVRLGGVSRDNEPFWDFQERLQKSASFGQVYPDVVQVSDARLSLGRTEQLFSLDMEYYPGARTELAAEEPQEAAATGPAVAAGDIPAGKTAVDAASVTATPAAAPVPPPATAGMPDGIPPAAPDAGTPAGPTRAAAPDDDEPAPAERRSARGNRRRNRPTRPIGGIQRQPFPAGSPLAPAPQMGKGQRPHLQGIDLADYTLQPDGTLKDKDGNVVTIDEVVPEFRLLREGELPPMRDPEEGDDDASTDPAAGDGTPDPSDASRKKGPRGSKR